MKQNILLYDHLQLRLVLIKLWFNNAWVHLLVFIWFVSWPTQWLPCNYLQRLNNTTRIAFTLQFPNEILLNVILKVEQTPKVICHAGFSTSLCLCDQILLSLTARFASILLKNSENNVHLNTEDFSVLWLIYVPQDSVSTNTTFCPHSCIYVFCVDLRTNSDYFPIQH